jgi:acetyl-CoA carboxylase biotin carboxyl carrier protein
MSTKPKGASGGSSVLTFEQIKELIDLVSEHELQGVEIERSGFKVRIDGRASASPPTASAVQPVAPAPSLPAPPTEMPSAARPEVSSEEPRLPEGGHVVTSPIVGTFYAAPNPEADPYVRVGDRVKTGQVLCIVEAMKLMNEIESDADGVILEIYVKNAQPVEYGEALFALQTA